MRNFSVVILFLVTSAMSVLVGADSKRIVFLAGPDSHGYGAHDFEAGAIYLAQCLNAVVPGIETQVVVSAWPEDPSILEQADAVIIYCDGLEDHVIRERHRPIVESLQEKGAGIGFVHYACAAEEDGLGQDMLGWIGGFYETYWTVNPQWEANFHYLPPHPVTRGVVPFDLYGEWYFNMRFRDDMEGIIPVLTATPPDHARMGKDGEHSGNPYVRSRKGMPEHVAWVLEGSQGKRGFALTGLHYYWNLGHPGLRKLMLNACLWLAGGNVPDTGLPVEPVPLEELEALNPAVPDEEWTTRERKEWAGRIDGWNRDFLRLSGPNEPTTRQFAVFRKSVLQSPDPSHILVEAISGNDDIRARQAFELFMGGTAREETAKWLIENTLSLPPDRQLMALNTLLVLEVPDMERLIVDVSRKGSDHAQVEAIRLLGTLQREEDLPFLMNQASGGNADIERAATVAFSMLDDTIAEAWLNAFLIDSDYTPQLKAIELATIRGQESSTEYLLRIGGQPDNPNNSAAIRAAGQVAPVDDATYRHFLQLFVEAEGSRLKRDWQMTVWELSQRQPDYPNAVAIIEKFKEGASEKMQRTLTGLGKKLMSLQ